MIPLTEIQLQNFLLESNYIENISGVTPTLRRQAAIFLLPDILVLHRVLAMLTVFQPGAVLRTRIGDDVRVGDHHAPLGGSLIEPTLTELLGQIERDQKTPRCLHVKFETLHPFTDGNGRTGRLLWLWQMVHHYEWDGRRTFLHEYYYQTLSEPR